MKGEEEDSSSKLRALKTASTADKRAMLQSAGNTTANDKRAMLQQFSSNKQSDVARFKNELKVEKTVEPASPKQEIVAEVVEKEKPKKINLSDIKPISKQNTAISDSGEVKPKSSLKALQDKKAAGKLLRPSDESSEESSQPRASLAAGGATAINREIEHTEEELTRSERTKLGLQMHYITSSGQQLAVCGSITEFGEWDVKGAMKMTYTKGANINWRLEVVLPSSIYFEYKYVLLDDTGNVIRWEPRVNRELQLMGTKGFRLVDEWGVENLEEELTRNEEAKRAQFENELQRIEEVAKETRRLREEKRAAKEEERKKREEEELLNGMSAEAAKIQAEESMREQERIEKQKLLEEEAKKREDERHKSLEEQRQKERQRRIQLEEEQQRIEEERTRQREERKKREEERRRKREEEDKKRQQEEEEFQRQRAERLANRSKRAEDSFSSLASRVPSHYNTAPTPELIVAPISTPEPAVAAQPAGGDEAEGDEIARKRNEMRKAREAKLKAEQEELAKEEEQRKKREEERKQRLADRRQNRQNVAAAEKAAEEKEREMKLQEEENKRKEQERLLRERQAKQEQFDAVVQKHKDAHEKIVALYQPSRVVKDTPFPISVPFGLDILFDIDDKIRHEALKEHLLGEGRLTLECAFEIVKRGTAILKTEPNVLDLKAPVVVVGDVHGQFYDLTTKLMDLAGSPEYVPYLFLGDYVDRGNFATEVILYLLALKIQYPNAVYLLRGNHECRSITMHYNFKSEVLYKYNLELYDLLMETFDALPLAGTISSSNGRYLCLHAGIGPGIKTIDDLMKLDRFQEIPERGPLCDVVWSDPVDENMSVSEKELGDFYLMNFKPNSTRGCSYTYGNAAVKKFLETNDLKAIIRGHEVQKYGYLEHLFKRTDIEAPLVITIFSAPNYCDKYENLGAFLKFHDTEYQFNQMTWTDHPFVLPQYLDAFTFTLPFIAENVAKVLLNALRYCIDIMEESTEDSAALKAVREKFKAKNKGMSKLMALLKMQSANNADMIQPFASKYHYNLSMFERAVQEDHNNELRPIYDARKLSKNKSTPAFRQVEMKTRRPVVNQRQATFAFSSKSAAKFDFV